MTDRILAPNRAPIGVDMPSYGRSVVAAATSLDPNRLRDTLLGGVSTTAGQAAAAASGIAGGNWQEWFRNIGISGIAGLAGIALLLVGIYSIVVPSKEFIIKQAT